MNALDQFLLERNAAIFLQCLGEKLTVKDKDNTTDGIFLSIELDNMNKLLYQSDSLMCTNKEMKLGDDIEYFRIENFPIVNKKANSKSIYNNK